VLFIPVSANRQDTLARKDFAAWIQRHIDRCFEFSLQFGIEIGGMQNIVFVTGRDCVRSWMNVAFFGGEKVRDARVSFGSNVDSRVSGVQWRALPENVRGAVLSQGPEGMVCWCVACKGLRILTQFWHLLVLLESTPESVYIYPRFSCRSYPLVLAKAARGGGGILVRSRQG